MNIKKILAKDLSHKFLYLFKNINVSEYYNIFLNSLNWSRDEIENYQIKKINQILRHAYYNSPFYKQRFDDSGFNIEKLKYLDDLKKIPPLSRRDIRENLDKLLARNLEIKRIFQHSSSGSSGTPIIFYHDVYSFGANKAALLLCKILGGYRLGDPWLNIWGNPATVDIEWKRFGSKVSRFLSNERRFPAYLLKDKEGFEKLYKLTVRTNPQMLYGYTNSLVAFARFLENENKEISSIERVFPTAETLQGYQRDILKRVFKNVYDHYGCSEINGVACQTIFDNSNYSIIEPRVFIEFGEVIDKRKNIRKILITDLHNKILPFLRYENGDIGIPNENHATQSGSPKFRKIKSIEGRINDVLKLPNGESLVVPNIISPALLKEIKGIQQYQIVCLKNKELLINLIIDESFNENSSLIILNYIKKYFPDNMQFKIVFNEEIIKTENGKFKMFVNLSD